jgi:hypothetical protein
MGPELGLVRRWQVVTTKGRRAGARVAGDARAGWGFRAGEAAGTATPPGTRVLWLGAG